MEQTISNVFYMQLLKNVLTCLMRSVCTTNDCNMLTYVVHYSTYQMLYKVPLNFKDKITGKEIGSIMFDVQTLNFLYGDFETYSVCTGQQASSGIYKLANTTFLANIQAIANILVVYRFVLNINLTFTL